MKNNRYKFIGLMVVATLVVMSVLIISSYEVEAEEFEEGGFRYEIIGDEVTVKGQVGGEREPVLPETVSYNGTEYTVTKIADNAFKNKRGIQNFTLPETLTAIGDSAFMGCDGIYDMKIPDKVTSIGTSAFEGCKLISVLYLSKDLTEIGDRAFFECIGLFFVEIPDKVTSIGKSAFEECRSIQGLSLSKNLTEISDRMFFNCTGLMYLDVPGSLKSIGKSAFESCGKLDGITLSDGLTKIGDRAFYNCGMLYHIEIPDTVESLGNETFMRSKLRSVILSENLTEIGNNTFNFCPLASIDIPDKVTVIGSEAFFNCTFLYDVFLPENLEEIGSKAFSKCGMYYMYIPSSVKTIGTDTFKDSNNIVVCIGSEDVLNAVPYKSNLLKVNYDGSETIKIRRHIDQVILDIGSVGDTYEVELSAGGEPVKVMGSGNLWSFDKGKHLQMDLDIVNVSEYDITVNHKGGDISGEGTYVHGNTVTLVATAHDGYEFKGWIEDDIIVHSAEEYSFDAYRSRILTALFVKIEYTITASAGPGGDMAPIGSIAVEHGTDRTFTVTADEGFEIDTMIVDDVSQGSSTSYTFVNVTEDHTISVTFKAIEYTVTVKTEGDGMIEGLKNPYHPNDIASLSATAHDGYEFKGWFDGSDEVYSGPDYMFTVNGPMDLTAVFENIEYTITVKTEGDGTIEGLKNPYHLNDPASLTATAHDGYKFKGWFDGDDMVHEHNVYEFPVTGDRALTASFEKMECVVTVIEDNTKGYTIGSGTYLWGDTVTLAAFPNDGYEFDEWSFEGISVSSENTYFFTITEDMIFSASFIVEGYDVSISVEEGTSDVYCVHIVPGETVTFRITMNEGFFINDAAVTTGTASLAFDGDDVLVFDVTSDCHIEIYAATEEYNVLVKTASGEPRGTFRYVLNGFVFMDEDNVFMLTDGDDLWVEAVPGEGFRFVEWRGDYSGHDPQALFDVCGNMFLTAAFEEVGSTETDDDDPTWLYLLPLIIAAVVALILWRDP